MHLISILLLITQLVIVGKAYAVQPVFSTPSRYRLGDSGKAIEFHIDSTFIISFEHQTPSPTNTYPVKYGEWAYDQSQTTLYLEMRTWDDVKIGTYIRQAWKLELDEEKNSVKANLVRFTGYHCTDLPISKSITRWTLLPSTSDIAEVKEMDKSSVQDKHVITENYKPDVSATPEDIDWAWIEPDTKLDKTNNSPRFVPGSSVIYDGGLHAVLSDSTSKHSLYNDGDDWAWVDKLDVVDEPSTRDVHHSKHRVIPHHVAPVLSAVS